MQHSVGSEIKMDAKPKKDAPILSNYDIQTQFLNKVKDELGSESHLADELSDILSISKDSAYRRIRGDTLLTIEEIRKLSTHLNISLDSLLNVKPSLVTFSKRSLFDKSFTFENYLKSIYENLQMLEKFEVKELAWAAKDVPIFHYCFYDNLTTFKLFFWQGQVLEYDQFKNRKLSLDDPSLKSLLGLTRSIYESYLRIPSVEIWSEETVNVTLRQIEYCRESGLVSAEDCKIVLEELNALVQHLQNQVTNGRKFLPGKEEGGIGESMKMYYNEISISDNTIFFEMEGQMITFMTYNMLSILHTNDESFCRDTRNFLRNIISKSILISGTSEKLRTKFFNSIQAKIDRLKQKVAAGYE